MEIEHFKIAILDAENGRVILDDVSCKREDLEEEVSALAESHEIVSSSFEWQEFSVVEDWR